LSFEGGGGGVLKKEKPQGWGVVGDLGGGFFGVKRGSLNFLVFKEKYPPPIPKLEKKLLDFVVLKNPPPPPSNDKG